MASSRTNSHGDGASQENGTKFISGVDVFLANAPLLDAQADIHRERAERYKEDRESWRARLRQYASARSAVVTSGDGFWSMDDDDEWEALLFSRWPVLSEDFVRGPPSAEVRESA